MIHISKTISNANRYLCIVTCRRTAEKVVGFYGAYPVVNNLFFVRTYRRGHRVEACKLLHLPHEPAVFQPFYAPGLVIIPYVGNNVRGKFLRRAHGIRAQLVTGIAAEAVVIPRNAVAIYVLNATAAVRTVHTNIRFPPYSTYGSRVVFEEIVVKNNVLVPVSMT